MQPIEIIYKHSDFIIIDKPCGISVHKDREETGLSAEIAAQLGVERVWLTHRLDKITSGLLILALNEQSAVYFFKLFKTHLIRKTYLALSAHKPKKKRGLVIGDMQKARRGAWKLCKSRENPAVTRFDSQALEPHLRLFVLKPQTGKTHQIRVAMKSLGSPILGDRLYGEKTDVDRVYLHAYQLEFDYYAQPVSVFCKPKCGVFWQKIENFEKIDRTFFNY